MPKKNVSNIKALIIYGATEAGSPGFSSDLLWRTRFGAPDAVLLIEIKGKRYLLVSSLEFGRACKTAKVDQVILLNKYTDRANPKSLSGGIEIFLREHSVKEIEVPITFPYTLGETLGKKFKVSVRSPLYPERMIKSSWEIKEIQKAQSATEAAFMTARKLLSKAKIRNNKIYQGSHVVTSESLRKVIDDELYHNGYLAHNTIVAGGKQAVDPHSIGMGPLPAHQAIIIDIFPYSIGTHYFGDFTRTVFKGEPSVKLIKMYETVRTAQLMAIKMLKGGVDGAQIHKAVVDYYTKSGYPTEHTKERVRGFIHSTGHGVGIDIHESPGLSIYQSLLKANMTVTVEPGLYYPQAEGHIPMGGIRIEDLLVVTRTGSKNLTHTPTDIKSAILK